MTRLNSAAVVRARIIVRLFALAGFLVLLAKQLPTTVGNILNLLLFLFFMLINFCLLLKWAPVLLRAAKLAQCFFSSLVVFVVSVALFVLVASLPTNSSRWSSANFPKLDNGQLANSPRLLLSDNV